jgi:mono/diheme cytochrome c family protein
MKIKNIICFALLLSLGLDTKANPDPPEAEGKAIFLSRCASCHNVNKTLTGPALAGVDQRRSIEWIKNFVRSSQAMIKNGDKDAVALYEKFNKIPMPDHPDLSDADVSNIVDFIKAEAKPVGEAKGPFAKPSPRKPAYTPLSASKDGWAFFCIIGAILLMIGALHFAVKVQEMKRDKTLMS